MNEYGARARQCGMGWIGEFRRVNRADFEAVECDGRQVRYPTATEAENAALRALLDIINTDYTAWRSVRANRREKAERVFDSIFVKGRQIEVQQK